MKKAVRAAMPMIPTLIKLSTSKIKIRVVANLARALLLKMRQSLHLPLSPRWAKASPNELHSRLRKVSPMTKRKQEIANNLMRCWSAKTHYRKTKLIGQLKSSLPSLLRALDGKSNWRTKFSGTRASSTMPRWINIWWRCLSSAKAIYTRAYKQ